MADKDTSPGNSRAPYKMVMIVTLWVDQGPEDDVMAGIAKQIVSHEVHDLVHGAGFKIGETDYAFETSVDSIEFIERQNLH